VVGGFEVFTNHLIVGHGPKPSPRSLQDIDIAEGNHTEQRLS